MRTVCGEKRQENEPQEKQQDLKMGFGTNLQRQIPFLCIALRKHPQIFHDPHGYIKVHEVLPVTKFTVRNFLDLPHAVQQCVFMDMQAFRDFRRLPRLS